VKVRVVDEVGEGYEATDAVAEGKQRCSLRFILPDAR